MAQVSSQNGGLYQIEVHAYNDCAYNLELNTTASVAVLGEQTSAEKELPSAPVVAVTNGPVDQPALPAAPAADAQSLFLPLTVR
ncbi:MAG: hypothetical protein IPK16_10610 [Anaerolineales bacterium]|nr:hypothetical protein [Anaerolineales bacterium]